MEFRAPIAAAQANATALEYLTENLSERVRGQLQVKALFDELGNAVGMYPDWHPILTAPEKERATDTSFFDINAYKECDHTVEFVRGFVTCPYSEEGADKLVAAVNSVLELSAYRLDEPLYADSAFPVVVVATEVELEADGTIRSRDALAWFIHQSAREAREAQVAETWWNIRSSVLGAPHGARSSLFVNQHVGTHMRKILEAMNDSGMFGPIKESSLEMLSQKKRDRIAETLLRTAIDNWKNKKDRFEFEFKLRDEICKIRMRDTWDDNVEISIRVEIGKFDLHVSGFYYPETDKITHMDPRGKRALAEKFL